MTSAEEFRELWRSAGLDDIRSEPDAGTRQVRLTTASQFPLKRTRWLWDGRIAVGTFAMLAGREGLGKSTTAYWLAGRVTRGELPGEFAGTPRDVLVCSTEEAWAEVIYPRLLAAGADCDRVHRVDVVTSGGMQSELSLPQDLAALEIQAIEIGAGLLILDPLMSRLGRADTHRDSETRLALEPLAKIAERSGMAVLGLIHHNKSNATDPLTQVMGSRAFTAVARSVHTVIEDPDDETRIQRLFGTVKNNLGPIGLPTLTFTIGRVHVGQDADDGTDVHGSCVVWGDDATISIADAFYVGQESNVTTQIGDARQLLRDLLDRNGGCVTSKDAKAAARQADISEATLKRAAKRMGLLVESIGYPRITTWTDPASVGSPTQSAHSGESV